MNWIDLFHDPFTLMALVRVLTGSPEQIVDRTWETTASGAAERGVRRRSSRTQAQIRAGRAE